MTDATELDEAAVRMRVEAATEGPWEWQEEELRAPAFDEGFGVPGFVVTTCNGVPSVSRADAEFIAHARTDLPAALDEITRLRAALDEARAEVGELRLSRAELGDECERLRSWVADGKAREIERIADAVAKVTPCACSAQRARAEAAESALAAVRAGLTEALDELVECRSFISIETRHYPTVGAINEVVERLRPLATPTTTERSETDG